MTTGTPSPGGAAPKRRRPLVLALVGIGGFAGGLLVARYIPFAMESGLKVMPAWSPNGGPGRVFGRGTGQSPDLHQANRLAFADADHAAGSIVLLTHGGVKRYAHLLHCPFAGFAAQPMVDRRRRRAGPRRCM